MITPASRPFLTRITNLFLCLFALLVGFAFTYAPGTTDMNIWQDWINHAVTRGVVQGFAANAADYPPLASVILFGGHRLFASLGTGTLLSIKYSLLIFLLLSALLFWFWTRSLTAAVILYFALLLNAMGLGYVDIFFAPALIVALWMLKERRWVLFSLSFTLACLTKWQPVIIAPFIGLYLLGIHSPRDWRQVDWKGLLLRVVLPAAALIAITLAVFGAGPVWQAFRASLSHAYLSGNALNLNWIITHFLRVTDPKQFGGLQNGLAGYIETTDPQITFLPRLLFWAGYAAALVAFFRREKTFANLIRFAILGYVVYFTFNTGVHENHLFLVTILAAVLYWLCAEWRQVAVLLMLMNSLNLFLFYGVDGTLHFPRLFAGTDVALPLAVLYVLFCLFLFQAVLRAQPQDEEAADGESLRRQPAVTR